MARVNWARQELSRNPKWWHRTVFSDEKRFCLDGPDGTTYYWADERMPKRTFMKRQNGGGGVMVWGAFCTRGKLPLVFIEGGLNAVKYTDLLSDVLLPFCEEKYQGEVRFQQDNAPAHSAVHTKEWFMEEGVHVMDWPARSPDCNPVENLWAIISHDVYANMTQYHSLDDLKEAIQYAWEKVPLETLKKLSNSMVGRCLSAVDKRGGYTQH